MEDLAKLPSIDDSIVLNTLKERHSNDHIYTKNGAVLVAINPYKEIGVSDEKYCAQYKASLALENEPPHIFAVAASSHRSLISEGKNQAVVISGESGAGKTESARFILQYLRYVSNASTGLEKRVTESQPITEAFGCAKTIRNDNSSRFGKFLKLYFDKSAKIKGASLSTYLLEKSRVTHIGSGERAYHIFYLLLRGLGASEIKSLRLPSADAREFGYLAHGDLAVAKHDASGLAGVREALLAQHIDAEEQWSYWQLMAGVLLLGNVAFDPAKTEAAAILPKSAQALGDCEAVLGLQPQSIGKALTKRKIKAGNEFVEQDLKLDAANDGRDALSKAIYSRLFDYLIAKINVALIAGETALSDADSQIIGIVDIFGFEVFQENYLEQLCINFTNEKLQALFTKTVFEETLKAYAADGIDAAEITYTDNKHILELVEAPGVGIWTLLCEECMVPKGSDKGFAEKLHDAQKGKTTLKQVKGLPRGDGFSIEHFAGVVAYRTKGWLDKNKDPLNGDLVALMQFADNPVLRKLFEVAEQPSGKGAKFKSNKFKGVVDTFRQQLTDLYNVLEASQLHFIRCFKPNDEKAPNLWRDEVVTRQLHTSGVLDALRVARTGYPDRMPFGDFASYFADVAGIKKSDTRPAKDKAVAVLAAMDVKPDKYKLGRERVFLSLGVLDALKTKRTEKMAKVVIVLQAGARGLSARVKARAIREGRATAQRAMEAAAQGDDIPALQAAILAAVKAGVGLGPRGAEALKLANGALQELQRIEAERKAASKKLDVAMHGYDMPALRSALEEARATGVDAEVIRRGADRLERLEEEERRRIEEEKRRVEEEKRLAAIAAAEARAAEEARMAEERRKREEEEARRRAEEEERRRLEEVKAQEDAAAAEAARVEAERRREAERQKAAIAAEEEAFRRAEEQEKRILQEEEELRQRTLQEVFARKIQFRSEPSDVLEYAVYLGMDLNEDIELLWIADEALQAEDPEGWDQAEAPNGDIYYTNSVTQQILWQHPLDYSYQQKYERLKNGESVDDINEMLQPSSIARAAESAKLPAAPAPQAAQPPGFPPLPPEQPGATPPEPPPERHAASSKGGASEEVPLTTDDALVARLQQMLHSRHGELRTMLLEPSLTSDPVHCFVLRHKSRVGAARFDFFMQLSHTKDMFCFCGKKQTSVMGVASRGAVYNIMLDQDDGKRSKESLIARIKSDRKANEYTLYDGGAAPGSREAKDGAPLRRELMHVHFINSLRNRNPGAMNVGVPTVDGSTGDATVVRPEVEGKDGLEARTKEGTSGAATVIFKNLEPKWNPDNQMYQLDFRGRATQASCKNIQLTYKDRNGDDAQMLMGKVDDNKFNVDFQYPFSALQAFAFALVVFDNSSSSISI